MLSAICFNLDQSKILLSDNGLSDISQRNASYTGWTRSIGSGQSFPPSVHASLAATISSGLAFIFSSTAFIENIGKLKGIWILWKIIYKYCILRN